MLSPFSAQHFIQGVGVHLERDIRRRAHVIGGATSAVPPPAWTPADLRGKTAATSPAMMMRYARCNLIFRLRCAVMNEPRGRAYVT